MWVHCYDKLMYGDTARPCVVDHTAARKWWWYTAFTLRNSEIRTGLGVLCASSSFSLKVTWMMYINQMMTSNVLAISAITIVVLFLQTGQAVAEQPQTMLHLHHTTTYLVDACCNHLGHTLACAQQRLWPHEQGQQQCLPLGQSRIEDMDADSTVEANPAKRS